ncbi:MAG: response regulator transcription factor [Oscillospiraceae bacterium]|nr:response regulator transcription factor [Oscillospiraceae bacterium]
MKVLMIEDNEATIHGLINEIEDRGWEKEVSSFAGAETLLYTFDPDVVVMDWMYDEEDADLGKPILERIVAKEFRPVIVFSAHDLKDTLADVQKRYPYVDFTRKGDDDSELIVKIEEWKDAATAISGLRHSMNQALVESSRTLDSFTKMDEFPDASIVTFMLSRRAIQYFEQCEIGTTPPAWIQYVYPPMNNSLLVADVIRIHSDDTAEQVPGLPEEYCVILTPSCDMVNHGDEDFRVLVAHCCAKGKVTEQRLSSGQNVTSAKGKEKVDRVVKELQYGYNKAFVALPQLPNVLPYMTADLKNLEFVLYSKIAPSFDSFSKEAHSHYRVASVASPFREQLVWAHMINSCRPGMPNRDTESWAKGILVE